VKRGMLDGASPLWLTQAAPVRFVIARSTSQQPVLPFRLLPWRARVPRRLLFENRASLSADGTCSPTNPGGHSNFSGSVLFQRFQQPLGQPQVVEPHVLPSAGNALNQYPLRRALQLHAQPTLGFA
jgi:hypothetical protein